MMDRKNLLLVTGILFFVGAIGFWIPYMRYERVETPSLSSLSPATAEVIIHYEKEGFVPATVTVKKGTTVGWVNAVGTPMWVASDPHPSHDILPGFDARRGLYLDDRSIFIKKAFAHGPAIYEYIFTELGKWKYHNHLNPAHRGTVVVTE